MRAKQKQAEAVSLDWERLRRMNNMELLGLHEVMRSVVHKNYALLCNESTKLQGLRKCYEAEKVQEMVLKIMRNRT